MKGARTVLGGAWLSQSVDRAPGSKFVFTLVLLLLACSAPSQKTGGHRLAASRDNCSPWD
jgi:hypothetical protein